MDASSEHELTSNTVELNSGDITSQRVGHIENQLLWKDLSSEEETTQVRHEL